MTRRGMMRRGVAGVQLPCGVFVWGQLPAIGIGMRADSCIAACGWQHYVMRRIAPRNKASVLPLTVHQYGLLQQETPLALLLIFLVLLKRQL